MPAPRRRCKNDFDRGGASPAGPGIGVSSQHKCFNTLRGTRNNLPNKLVTALWPPGGPRGQTWGRRHAHSLVLPGLSLVDRPGLRVRRYCRSLAAYCLQQARRRDFTSVPPLPSMPSRCEMGLALRPAGLEFCGVVGSWGGGMVIFDLGTHQNAPTGCVSRVGGDQTTSLSRVPKSKASSDLLED